MIKTTLYLLPLTIFLTLMGSCNQRKSTGQKVPDEKSDSFVLAFGSCNNQHMENKIWPHLEALGPDVFVWGGDIIYSDTYDMDLMRTNYTIQKEQPGYRQFASNHEIMGTWDDHDYGLNDGGADYTAKDSVQSIFLDFFDVPASDERRQQKGIYTSKVFDVGEHRIKIIVLDMRFFRTELIKDPSGKKRYIPDSTGNGTMLGETQWHWLARELNEPDIDFRVIMSSIQFLSAEHGFETWGNMPNESNRLLSLLEKNPGSPTIILSGDRHLAEISAIKPSGLAYRLIDITSSGMTHSYTSYKGESNSTRISEVISQKNFGLLKFDLSQQEVLFEIRGENNEILASHLENYQP